MRLTGRRWSGTVRVRAAPGWALYRQSGSQHALANLCRAQLGRQYGNRFSAQERLRLTLTDGTATKQPMDVVALAVGDAIEREDVGTLADFYHRRPPQVIAQFWMAHQDHRKT